MFTGNVVCAIDDETRLALPRLVADVADALDLAVLDQLGQLARDRVDRRLERNLGEDDRLRAARTRFDLVHRSHPHRAAPGAERVLDAFVPHDEAARREIGALHVAHQLRQRRVGLVDQPDRRVADLVEVVRRNVRGHADRNALRPVHQQFR
jgi:hypothetical protein